jgi:hypothetical protein
MMMHGPAIATLHHSCTYNRVPEDEPSGTKHVEYIIKIKMLVYKW